jgi:hypothetical protein
MAANMGASCALPCTTVTDNPRSNQFLNYEEDGNKIYVYYPAGRN